MKKKKKKKTKKQKKREDEDEEEGTLHTHQGHHQCQHVSPVCTPTEAIPSHPFFNLDIPKRPLRASRCRQFQLYLLDVTVVTFLYRLLRARH
jgi:hypothetical protein